MTGNGNVWNGHVRIAGLFTVVLLMLDFNLVLLFLLIRYVSHMTGLCFVVREIYSIEVQVAFFCCANVYNLSRAVCLPHA